MDEIMILEIISPINSETKNSILCIPVFEWTAVL